MNEVCEDGLWQRWKINPLNMIRGEGMEEEIPGHPGLQPVLPSASVSGQSVYGHHAWGSRGHPTTTVDPPEDSNTHLRSCHH